MYILIFDDSEQFDLLI